MPIPSQLFKVIDFTNPSGGHWASFQGGTNNDAMFDIRGQVQVGDEILVRLQSGRTGRYRLFSVLHDFRGIADYTVRARAISYWPDPSVAVVASARIKGQTGACPRWIRSSSGELAHLPSNITKPADEFWKILARHDASRARTDRMLTTGHM